MQPLTGFQRDLLTVIAGLDQPSGQDVKAELSTRYESEINHGRLYPNLDTLVDSGYVEKGDIDRRTNYYELSSEGAEAIRERRAWEDQYLEPVLDGLESTP